MARRLPDSRVHEDRGIQSHYVFAGHHHTAPPGLFDVANQLGAQRPVVPGAGKPAIDFGACEYKAAPLGERDQRVEIRRSHG